MRNFLVDEQTIADLQLLDSSVSAQSIFSLFDYTTTIGGKTRLKEFFSTPSADIAELQRKSNHIKFFADSPVKLVLERESLDFIEFYLRRSDKPAGFNFLTTYENNLRNYFSPNQDHYTRKRGVLDVYDILKQTNKFCDKVSLNAENKLIAELKHLTDNVLADLELEKKGFLFQFFKKAVFIATADFTIRNLHLEKIKRIFQIIYDVDAYQSIAQAATNLNLSFPTYIIAGEQRIKLEGLFHPLLSKPIPNDICLNINRNVCLLTGPNMAGKSTLVKAIAVSFYLAHLGFPIPAKKMETHVFDGLFTSINLSDNLSLGHSHFYTEVLRVKCVLEAIKERKKLLVIFDELFRGTNVKDAYESSVLVVEKFTNITNCLFIISSHLIEVAEELNHNNHILFKHFQSSVIDGKPSFTYKLVDGITDERLGRWILRKEGIIDLLNDFNNREKQSLK